jgi:hypothetical protein
MQQASQKFPHCNGDCAEHCQLRAAQIRRRFLAAAKEFVQIAMDSKHRCWNRIAKKDVYSLHLNVQIAKKDACSLHLSTQGMLARTAAVDALIQFLHQIAKKDACSLQLTVQRMAARTTADSNWIAKMGACCSCHHQTDVMVGK